MYVDGQNMDADASPTLRIYMKTTDEGVSIETEQRTVNTQTPLCLSLSLSVYLSVSLSGVRGFLRLCVSNGDTCDIPIPTNRRLTACTLHSMQDDKLGCQFGPQLYRLILMRCHKQ